MANGNPISPNIPFRIRLGVTGHRQLENPQILSQKIEQILRELKNGTSQLFDDDSKRTLRSVNATPIVFSILTPLAEGTDRLVAKEVLRFPDSSIEVVLPLTKEDYLQDFETEESRQDFETFFSQARRPITLKKHSLHEEFPGGDLNEERRKAYEIVGQYVVDHCDVLIAIWDGEPSRGKGGTADIIEYARKRGRPTIIISTQSPYAISIEKGNGLYIRSIRKIEAFNIFHIAETAQREYVENVYHDLFNNPEGGEIPAEAKNLVKEKLLPFYVRASMIAKANQKLYRYVGLAVYAFSAAAVASVALGILFFNWSPYAFFFEFLLLLAILILIIFADRHRAHKNWIENRYLAEPIRSVTFLATCGVETLPIELPAYMRIAHHPDDWMVKAFDEIWNRLPPMRGCKEEFCRQCIAFVRKHWIQDQIKYHKDNSIRSSKIAQILEWGGLVTFFLAMAAVLSHLIFFLPPKKLDATGIETFLTFLAIALPAVGAAIGGIRSHREYSRLEKRSRNMEAVLTDLDERFSQISNPEELESLLRETEELMVRETQDWLMFMKFAELKLAA